MPIVVTQEGATALIQWALQMAPPSTPLVHLLGSPHDLAHLDTEATLSAAELSVQGYSAISLSNPGLNWTLNAQPDGRAATYAAISWSLLAGCSIYGYWLSTADSAVSLWGETLPTPVVIPPAGGPFPLEPSFYLVSQPFTQGECG